MSLIDKLIDKVIGSAKKKKTDSIVAKLAKGNPGFSKAVDNLKKSSDDLKREFEAIAKKKGIKLK